MPRPATGNRHPGCSLRPPPPVTDTSKLATHAVLSFDSERWFVPDSDVRRILTMLGILILLAAGWCAWLRREPLTRAWNRHASATAVTEPTPPGPRPDDYRALIEDAKRWRKDLASRYQSAARSDERAKILDETRGFLETLLPSMMRCWLGTPWDFNGTAEQPGKGRIACGYFVSTVLRDAGFRINRYQLAKQPSENILRTFLPRDALLRRIGIPYETFVAETAGLPDGVYLAGLDTHVAFLVIDRPGAFRFIHSSGSPPWCVVEEGEQEAAVLRASRYRILGNLTADRKLALRWLNNEPMRIHGTN